MMLLIFEGPPIGNINILIHFLGVLNDKKWENKTLNFLSIVYITFVFRQKSETEGTIDDTDDAYS